MTLHVTMEQTNLVDAAPVFAALGDPTRLRLVAQLCAAGPLSIVRLTDGAHITRQAVTKHLQLLARAGLVRSTRDGRERIWEIEPRRIADVGDYLEHISSQWDAVLDRLRVVVES
jgi:DNA-binding transcriptional ArsR family regulator